MLYFMLAPWARQIRALKAIPRSFADDLLVIATGPNHEQIFKKAYSTTLSYLHCIGAALFAKKCFTFSTSDVIREDLRHHWWTHIGARIPTIISIRDLGGMLASASAPTLFLTELQLLPIYSRGWSISPGLARRS